MVTDVQRLRQTIGVTQETLAKAAGTSQPTIAAYESGRKSPTLATLRRLAASAGLELWVEFHPALTREERRSLFLHEAIARKLAENPERVLALARATLSRMIEKHLSAAPILREWDLLLDRPLPDLIGLLTDPAPRARELRHVTPFAGILSAAERAATYRAFARQERAA